jgi:Bacterial protein of unknown function (DUF839)
MSTPHAAPRRSRLVVMLAAGTLGVIAVSPVAAAPGGQGNAGFRTSVPSMVVPGADAPAGTRIDPIVSSGDVLPSGFVFDSIPDGIAFTTSGEGRADLYVNHETSLVPFPGNLTDYTNSHVDQLKINQHSAGILTASDAIPSEANYQRFCSNFLAGPAEGFTRQILFTNEEATDWVNRSGLAWPATPFAPGAEQAGAVVALDVKSGEYRTIYGMGRHNHENSVAIPGYDELVVLSGDDTFQAPASQLYSYIADDTDAVWNDEGSLWAFVSDDPATNDYGDLSLGEEVTGRFIPVPRHIATGKDPVTGAEIDGATAPPSGVIRGPQWALEEWSNQNNVFQFIRVEDIAYDRNDPSVVYFADTGEPRARPWQTGDHPLYQTRLFRGASGLNGQYPNGRIFRMVLDESDPRQVDSLSILIDGDRGTLAEKYANRDRIHQPDNIETTAGSLLIQEDPGSHNQHPAATGYPAFPNASNARVWRYDLGSGGELEEVLEVSQALDNAPGDANSAVAGRGGWESSGIIDASAIWGPGWFLIDVQAPTLATQRENGTLGTAPVVFEREGGQLLRVRIPGS